jgi:DNA-binding transcriptional regulator GbsR (MarR family)
MNKTELIESFVLHFGEMGSRWGINRTVGQIYALLFLSPEPLHAEAICETLGFSRSNVSNSIKELDGWNLIIRKHLPNDRREYFTTPEDEWEIFRTLIEERRKREVTPTLQYLQSTLENHELSKDTDNSEAFAHQRMDTMYKLISTLNSSYEEISQRDTQELKKLLSLGQKAQSILKVTDKIRGKFSATK